jgi:hypothetical protein
LPALNFETAPFVDDDPDIDAEFLNTDEINTIINSPPTASQMRG